MLVDVPRFAQPPHVHTISRQRGEHPILYSHAHTWDTIDSSKRHEKYIQEDEIHMITDTGGMVGLRTGFEKAFTLNPSILNTCEGSTGAFGQSLTYAVDHGLTVGFGADLNGFIQQLKPRYKLTCPVDRILINQAANHRAAEEGPRPCGLLPGHDRPQDGRSPQLVPRPPEPLGRELPGDVGAECRLGREYAEPGPRRVGLCLQHLLRQPRSALL